MKNKSPNKIRQDRKLNIISFTSCWLWYSNLKRDELRKKGCAL